MFHQLASLWAPGRDLYWSLQEEMRLFSTNFRGLESHEQAAASGGEGSLLGKLDSCDGILEGSQGLNWERAEDTPAAN